MPAIFGQWGLIQAGFYVFLTYRHHCLSISSLLGAHVTEIILHFPYPSSEIGHFSQTLLFLLVEKGI